MAPYVFEWNLRREARGGDNGGGQGEGYGEHGEDGTGPGAGRAESVFLREGGDGIADVARGRCGGGLADVIRFGGAPGRRLW
jgi:hypothetical protein